MPRITTMTALRQPARLDEPGLLVGWSLEFKSKRPTIGFNYGHPLKTPDTGYIDPILLQGEGHLITVAPTGAGKGTGCIVPALLRYAGPVIVIDPKGENVAITARHRRQMGHRVVVIDPLSTTGVASDHFNPLDAVDITQARAVSDVAALATSLMSVVDSDDARNRYWVQRGTHLLRGVMLLVLQEAHEAREAGGTMRANLMRVREIVNDAAADPAPLAKLMLKSRHPEVKRIAHSLNIKAAETLGGVISFAQGAVDFVQGDDLEANVADTTFDLDDVTRGAPLSIYLVLPPHNLESHGPLLRMWLTALIHCITRRRAKPAASTLFILDEAAQLGELAQLRQAVTLLRGYGLQTWSFWQDVSQLQLLYPRDWKTMVNNCKVLQCFGALNQVAASDMAGLTGFMDGIAVLDLGPQDMILQVAGDQAVVAQLPNYLTDPAFAGLFDSNPFHDPEREVMPAAGAPQRLYERPERPESGDKPSKREMAHAVVPVDDPLLARLLAKWSKHATTSENNGQSG
jgi:type IV secretion system protein VirD4